MNSKKTLLFVLLCALVAVLGFVIVYRIQGGEKSPLESTSPTNLAAPQSSAAATATPEPTPTPTPDPFGDRPELDIASWELAIANNENPLASDFIPEVTALEGGQSFDSRAVISLQEFIAAARAQGLSVILTSSYRSFVIQQSLFSNKVNQYIYSEGSREAAEAKAMTIVAYPGTSEHQLGLSVDIVDKIYEYMNEDLENTELSKWLKEHCAEYGFVLRYPKDKVDVTEIMFEPWHYRYVGKTAASYIMEKGLALEEFVALYK